MKARIRRLHRQRLSTQVVIMMVAILAVTMAAGFFVVQWNLIRHLTDQLKKKKSSLISATTIFGMNPQH